MAEAVAGLTVALTQIGTLRLVGSTRAPSDAVVSNGLRGQIGAWSQQTIAPKQLRGLHYVDLRGTRDGFIVFL